ncbi:Mediator of RNA polymerase II transcription subunit 16 [Sporothrix eucalyptigena]
MRNIVILITIASNTPGNLKDKLNPLDEPDVVDALAGCAKWALDLLAYTCDCIFSLLEDPKFITIQYNEHQQQQSGSSGSSALRAALITSYHKMQQYTSSSLIRVEEFDKLLWALGENIRQAYQIKIAAQGGGAAVKKQGQGQNQAVDPAAKRFQAQCEVTLLLANNMPPNFQPLLYKFFNENVRNFRAQTDPAKLYFADYSILEVEDDGRSLQEKRARRTHIDVFKRVELKPANSKNGATNGTNTASARHPMQFPPHSSPSEYLRRCVRCTSIMEDVVGARPGYTFVLAQQRIPIKLLNEAQGHIVTLEITSGQTYRGRLLEAEDNMNVQLKDITVTARDGRVSHLEQVYIRGSHVRFFIVPDMLRNAPMFRSRNTRGRGVGLARGRATVSRARAGGRGR